MNERLPTAIPQAFFCTHTVSHLAHFLCKLKNSTDAHQLYDISMSLHDSLLHRCQNIGIIKITGIIIVIIIITIYKLENRQSYRHADPRQQQPWQHASLATVRLWFS